MQLLIYMRKITRLQLCIKVEVLISCLQVMRVDGVSHPATFSDIQFRGSYITRREIC